VEKFNQSLHNFVTKFLKFTNFNIFCQDRGVLGGSRKKYVCMTSDISVHSKTNFQNFCLFVFSFSLFFHDNFVENANFLQFALNVLFFFSQTVFVWLGCFCPSELKTRFRLTRLGLASSCVRCCQCWIKLELLTLCINCRSNA